MVSPSSPLVADLMCGPNAPLTRAFIMCGWRAMPIDRLLDTANDLADEAAQLKLHTALTEVDLIVAALDCSTKSAARSIPRATEGGRCGGRGCVEGRSGDGGRKIG